MALEGGLVSRVRGWSFTHLSVIHLYLVHLCVWWEAGQIGVSMLLSQSGQCSQHAVTMLSQFRQHIAIMNAGVYNDFDN